MKQETKFKPTEKKLKFSSKNTGMMTVNSKQMDERKHFDKEFKKNLDSIGFKV